MTAQFFTSIVVNSLFLAFFAAFYDPNVDGIRKTIWGWYYCSSRLVLHLIF